MLGAPSHLPRLNITYAYARICITHIYTIVHIYCYIKLHIAMRSAMRKTMSVGDVTSDCRAPHNMGPSDCTSQSGTHIILGHGPTRTGTHLCTFAHIYIYTDKDTQNTCTHAHLF